MTRALLSALALGLMAMPTSTSTYLNCNSMYVGFLERVIPRAPAMSGDQLAALHRRALRIFDACDSGHLGDVQAKFVELEKRAH